MNQSVDPHDLRAVLELDGVFISDERFNEALDVFVERKQRLIDAGLYDGRQITEEEIVAVLGHEFDR